jgi:hypothetical protein
VIDLVEALKASIAKGPEKKPLAKAGRAEPASEKRAAVAGGTKRGPDAAPPKRAQAGRK